MKGVVSAKRRQQARKHAKRARTCACGKIVYGNGGWSSHRRACERQRAVAGIDTGDAAR